MIRFVDWRLNIWDKIESKLSYLTIKREKLVVKVFYSHNMVSINFGSHKFRTPKISDVFNFEQNFVRN